MAENQENIEKKEPENSAMVSSQSETNDLTTLTEQNWLFINAFLQCGNIVKSYKIAGYKGENRSAPYQLFKQLKSRIEDLGNLDVTSRARLQADLKQVLDLPLDPNKKHLTLSEWLRVRKFSAAINPEVQQPQKQISVLVINRGSQPKGERDTAIDEKGSNPKSDFPLNDVIDVDPLI